MKHDPTQLFIYFVLGCLGVGAVIIVGIVAIPIGLMLLAAAAIVAYNNRPKPSPSTAELRAATEAAPAVPSEDEFVEAAVLRFVEACEQLPIEQLLTRYVTVTRALYRAEDLANPLPPLPPGGDVEEGRYRDRLLARTRKLANKEQVLPLLSTSIGSLFLDFTRQLPALAVHVPEELEKASSASIPLLDVVTNAGELTRILVAAFFNPEVVKADLFHDIREQLEANIAAASQGKKATIFPQDSRLPQRELIETYLAETPLLYLFDVEVPFNIETHHRLEHTAIVAGSGWGKTQLLQWQILQDLEQPDPPSIIVLDSTGQMVERIQRLALFSERLRDRILIIDPAHSPALNMFDISTERLAKYTPDQREDVQSEIISLFNYIFASDDYDLTSRQGTVFAYAVRLILSRPGSTITHLRQLLEEQLPTGTGYQRSAFREHIEKLGEDAQDFFKSHFYSTGFASTRLQIAQRLHKVIGVPAFRRMFTAGTNALDLFNDMQKGTIVLVNTNQQLLKEESYVLFGRYVVARVLAAAFERATIPEAERRPTFLIIDEAAPYFDKTFESLLTRVRQFKLGVVIAFQHLEQASEKMRSAIASSTSVKYAGGLGFTDRRWLSREMETSPEFIGAQKKDIGERPRFTKFAAFVRNYTPHALSLTVPIGLLERQPRMSDADYEAMLAANLKRVAPAAPQEGDPVTFAPPPPVDAPPTAPMDGEDDPPTTWGDATIKGS